MNLVSQKISIENIMLINKIYFNTPKGIRIPVCSVKGSCPRPLDDGGEKNNYRNNKSLKRATRFERATSTLARLRSTTELCPLQNLIIKLISFSI